MPDDQVNCLCVADDGLWIGTPHGLARYARGVLKAHPAGGRLADAFVTSIALHEPTGDVWIGTLGGLTRYSAGRLIHYNQLNSGLISDVVHGVSANRAGIWVATAAGGARYDPVSDEWTLFDRSNSPAPELTFNGVSAAEDRIAVAVFGGGVLEYHVSGGRWRGYVDPDGDRVTDLLRDDGLIHDFVTDAVHDAGGRLWAGTPFGLSCFDGRVWRSFRGHNSPLASKGVNCLATQARFVWIGTDDAFHATDGDRWIAYRRGPAEPAGAAAAASPDSGGEGVSLPDSFPDGPIRDIVFDGDDIWVATDGGLARGKPVAGPPRNGNRPSLSAHRAPEAHSGRLTPTQALPLRLFSDPEDRFYERLPPVVRPRDAAPAPAPKSVKLGFVGPPAGAREAPVAREMLDGFRLALEEANEAGGYQGVPFELVVRRERGLWGGTAANEIVALAREDGVVSVFGPVDGASALAAVQVAGRLRLPVVSTAATDPGLTETGGAWLIRNMPDDRRQAYALAHHVYNECGIETIAGMRSDDRFGYVGLTAFREASDRLGHPLRLSLRWVSGQVDFGEAINQIVTSNVGGVVLWGPAPDAARIVRQIRARGLPVRIFGCDRLASESFLKSAGSAAEGVAAVATYDPTSTDPQAATFRETFSSRWAYQPGTFAAHAYDGARMLVECIRRVGPDPLWIGMDLGGLAEDRGVAGTVRFDTTLNGVGDLHIAQVADGRLAYRAVDLAAMPPNSAVRALDRELRRYPFAAPGEPGLHNRRRDYNLGWFWPLDERGRSALLGAELAVIEDASLHPRGPPICLHGHDARADWGTQSAALVDLVREDEVLAILGPSDGPVADLLGALAARVRVPIVAPCGGAAAAREIDAGWWVPVPPSDRPAGDVTKLYEQTFGSPPPPLALPGSAVCGEDLRTGYEAARLVIQAIRGGATTRAGLADALRSTGRFDTPSDAGQASPAHEDGGRRRP